MPSGVLKRAAAPVPFVEPAEPAEPASVETAPAAVILRIVSLRLSPT